MARIFKDDKCFVMMRNVAIVNTCSWGSTGKIAIGLYENLKEKGYNVHFYYGRGAKRKDPNHHRIDTPFESALHFALARISGLQGGFSRFATKRMLASMKIYGIDTIYLISAHGYYLNEKDFFSFVAKNNIRLIYTMIDEYAYSGACCNDPICEKIKTGKGKCPNIWKYPESLFFDSCSSVLNRKKKCYMSMNNASFVGPEFLVESSKKSVLGKYMNTMILDEAIDVQLYHPCDSSSLRAKYHIKDDKIILLCVAPSSRPHRGAHFFIEAAKRLSDDKRFIFIHVGYQFEETKDLPQNYIPIRFVEKDSDLAIYYSMADVLVNPSITDAMSNTCLEAMACGTPLICFNISGMPYLMDDTVGKLIAPRDVDAIVDAIKTTTKKTPEIVETCRKYAEKRYDNKKYADKLISIANKGNH